MKKPLVVSNFWWYISEVSDVRDEVLSSTFQGETQMQPQEGLTLKELLQLIRKQISAWLRQKPEMEPCVPERNGSSITIKIKNRTRPLAEQSVQPLTSVQVREIYDMIRSLCASLKLAVRTMNITVKEFVCELALPTRQPLG